MRIPLPFDTELRRWMLSYGAGSWLLPNHLNSTGISLKIEGLELIYYANAYPVCMYSGLANETSTKSCLDYSSYLDAATAGAFGLQQNICLLHNLMKLGVEGWLRLIKAGRVCPQEIDWLLCCYSSHFFLE